MNHIDIASVCLWSKKRIEINQSSKSTSEARRCINHDARSRTCCVQQVLMTYGDRPEDSLK